LIVNIEARTHDEAFQQAVAHFDQLRAVINWICVKTVSRQFGRPSPVGTCLPPPIYAVFLDSGAFETTYYSVEGFDYKENNLDSKEGKQVEKKLAQISRVGSEIRSIIEDCLLKYVQATDTIDWRNAFLCFWQILEAIAHPQYEEGKSRSVVARIEALLGQNAELRDLLTALESTRHRLVHLGKFSMENIEVTI
jgi:hypothetical protein